MILCYHFNSVHPKLPFKRVCIPTHHARVKAAPEAVCTVGGGQPGLKPQTKPCPGHRRANGEKLLHRCSGNGILWLGGAPYLIAKTGRPLQEGLASIFVHYEPTSLWGDLPGCG